MDKRRMLEKLLSKSEFASIAYSNALNDDNSLLSLMATNNVYRRYDWKDLVTENDFFAFVSERAIKLTNRFLKPDTMSATALFRVMNKNKQEGDWLPFLFGHYDKLIQQNNLGIVFLDKEDDSYSVFVVQRENISKLQRIKSDMWVFKRVKKNLHL